MKRKPSKKGKKTSKRRKSRMALRRKADKLFSIAIRERDGRCVLCGSRERLQAAHLWSRRYLNTRWDPENVWTLCSRDHWYYTTRPIEWDDVMRSRLGEEQYQWLRARALEKFDGDLERILVLISQMQKENSEREGE